MIKDVMPRGLNKIIDEKQQAIEENNIQHHLAIETKDTTITTLNDDIDELIANRHVPHRDGFDNILAPYVKNEPPYYMIRCQKRNLNQQIKILRVKYPNMEERGIYEDITGYRLKRKY